MYKLLAARRRGEIATVGDLHLRWWATFALRYGTWLAGRSSFTAARSTFALRAMVDNLRMDHERRLVDAGRIELPTSALRTQRSPS